MNRKISSILVVGLSLLISSCAVTSGTGSDEDGFQKFDPALIPAMAPEGSLSIEPSVFDTGFSEFAFKVGEGPTWCSLNVDGKFVICEQNEADATYDLLPVPDSCKLSYGYQLKLFESKPENGSTSQITCTSGLYADPALLQTLNPGETLTVGELTCFVSDITARCDNKKGNYIVLGPEVWAKD